MKCKRCGKTKWTPVCPYCGFVSFVIIAVAFMLAGCSSLNKLITKPDCIFAKSIFDRDKKVIRCLDDRGDYVEVEFKTVERKPAFE